MLTANGGEAHVTTGFGVGADGLILFTMGERRATMRPSSGSTRC
jgi:hypothetical protein